MCNAMSPQLFSKHNGKHNHYDVLSAAIVAVHLCKTCSEVSLSFSRSAPKCKYMTYSQKRQIVNLYTVNFCRLTDQLTLCQIACVVHKPLIHIYSEIHDIKAYQNLEACLYF